MYNQACSELKCNTCARRPRCKAIPNYESTFYAMKKIMIDSRLFSTELHCDAYEPVTQAQTNSKVNYIPMLQR